MNHSGQPSVPNGKVANIQEPSAKDVKDEYMNVTVPGKWYW